jgi:hypothetical protein
MLVFSIHLCELAPLTFSLVQVSLPAPLPCVNKYTCIQYTDTEWGGGGYGVLGLRHLPRSPVPLQVIFLDVEKLLFQICSDKEFHIKMQLYNISWHTIAEEVSWSL